MKNRIIKFRAWVREFTSDKGEMIAWFPQFFSDMSRVTGWSNEFPDGSDTVHLMQFTGIHDLNGEEMYEGDIVEWACGRGYIFFRHGSFWRTWTEKGDDGRFSGCHGVPAPLTRNLAVIGNIYEQPHLLDEDGILAGEDDEDLLG